MDRIFRYLYHFFALNAIRIFYLLPLIFISFITLEWIAGGMLLGHFPRYGLDPDPTALFGELLSSAFAMIYLSLGGSILGSPIVILLSFIYKRTPSILYLLAYPTGIAILSWFLPSGILLWVAD